MMDTRLTRFKARCSSTHPLYPCNPFIFILFFSQYKTQVINEIINDITSEMRHYYKP